MGMTKLYQTEWNGISLYDISNRLGKPLDIIASCDFYMEFYRQLSENGWDLQKEFLEDKKLLGKLVFSKINPEKSDNIISLGAGLGICELEAIRGGYCVELQEVQKDSFKYLDILGVEPAKVWITDDCSIILSDTYDYVIVNHLMYCFDDSQYKIFLNEVYRMLKEDGTLIITAELYTEIACIKNSISNIKALRRVLGKNNNRVFWGYLRTVKKHVSMLSQLFQVVDYGQLENGSVSLDYSYYICKKSKQGVNVRI